MKTILSLWTLLCVICLCECMDRHRNKICYTAMTCIHNARERCGVDGKGNYRRFYDSCDMLEFNCLKNKDYGKTTIRSCEHLPPIDDGSQSKEGVSNNAINHDNNDVGKISKSSKEEVEGTLTINNNGDVEGEVIIDDDKVLEPSPNTEKYRPDESGADKNNADFNNENIPGDNEEAVEGSLTINDNGDMEGEIIINDDKVLDSSQNKGKSEVNVANGNQQNTEIEEEVAVDDNGSVEEQERINKDEANESIKQTGSNTGNVANSQDESGIEGEVKIDDEGNIEGEIRFDSKAIAEQRTGEDGRDISQEAIKGKD